MTLGGESPYPVDQDRILEKDELDSFTREVVWPAIRFLTGVDFLNEAVSGEDVYCRRTVITPHGRLRIRALAQCWEEEPEDQEDYLPGKTFKASLGIERSDLDLHGGFLKAAGLDDTGVESETSAWDVADFEFLTGVDAGAFSKQSFELQDEEGDVVWSSDYESVDVEGSRLEDAGKILAMEIDQVFGLSERQCAEIVSALAAIGVGGYAV